jgi:hypothetical protein
MESLYLVGIAVLALFAFVLTVILFNFFGLWLRARIANAPVSLGIVFTMLSDVTQHVHFCRIASFS